MSGNKITKSKNNPLEEEYNVKKALQKLRTRNNVIGLQTDDNYNNDIYSNNQSYGNKITNEPLVDSTTLVGMTDNMHSRYDKLKDDLTNRLSESKKETDACLKDIKTDIGKIESEYLKEKWFILTISALVAFAVIIATVFYTLSYSDVTTNIKETKKDIDDIKTEVKEIKEKVPENGKSAKQKKVH